MNERVINRAADNIRLLSVAMVEKAKSGHPGGAMGGADFVNVLFSEFLQFDPDDGSWPFRDRFFLDPGHMSPMLYSVLALCNKFTMDDLKGFRQWGSLTHGHPEYNLHHGIENTSGPLGMGHAMALGAAIAERFLASRFGEWTAHKTYTFISDGGIQEEISQGVGRLAGHLGLANYIMFYDSNGVQLSHTTSHVSSEDVGAKYRAWGWRVETIDGNNADAIRGALQRAVGQQEQPSLIIGKTVMGKNAIDANGNAFEGKVSTHGQPISKAGASITKTIEHLGGNPENPFMIFDDVAAYYKQCLATKKEQVHKRKEQEKEWSRKNAALATELDRFLQGKQADFDFSSIKHKANCATRTASGQVLGVLGENMSNIIVSSADLSNSDNTNKFLDKTTEFQKGHYSGAFLQAGVSELTMAAVMNGIALHGGIVPVCGTFFVFSDYMKPAVRLAALMGLPVKYVWTHDSFRVGEDGPTHQPVEQEAQIRLMEKMENFAGKRSMLVLRPADAAETTVAWKMALANTTTPTALILSRQDIPDSPVPDTTTHYEHALQAEKGAYIIGETAQGSPDIILLANGSEVSLCVETAEKLHQGKKMVCRVVSVISEGLFREQSREYQEKIIPVGIPVFGVTAGLPVSLAGLTGPFGSVYGLCHFGASAPYTVLDEKYGYTSDNIIREIERYLKEYKENIKKYTALHK